MTPWTRNDDIKKRLLKKWQKGEFLARSVGSAPFEPLRIPLKRPNAKELAHEFDKARTWVAHIIDHAGTETKKGFDIEWQVVNHRTLGKNKMPKAVIFHTLDDLAAYLGKAPEIRRYHQLFKKITAQFPELEPLLMEKPLDVLAHDKVWPQLLAIVSWIRDHTRPGIYIRQLEIPGVDTKFIETHRGWLTRLLTAALPPESLKDGATGKGAFERRFGFKPKPARIRFRILDPTVSPMGLTDLAIPAEEFNHLTIRPDTIFVVENEITGLSFPPFPRAMVIIGLGYALSCLSSICWMKDRAIWYWGDMDTHGFAMLDQIRHYFPQTRSFLMDEATLLTHKALWGTEPTPTHRDLTLLTPEEADVYDRLRYNRYAIQLRMEQERIPFSLVRRVVKDIQKDHLPVERGGI